MNTSHAVLLALAATAACITNVRAADKSDLSYCTVCHGAHGNGNPAIRAPKIAGMEPWYIRRQLEAFRDGVRGTHPDDAPGQEMQPVGVRLRDEARIQEAIEYVASFEPKAPPITITGDATRGRNLFVTCESCHGIKRAIAATLPDEQAIDDVVAYINTLR
jgi:cytochrome c553